MLNYISAYTCQVWMPGAFEIKLNKSIMKWGFSVDNELMILIFQIFPIFTSFWNVYMPVLSIH